MTSRDEPQPTGECILGIDPGLRITGYAVVATTAEGPRIREAGIIDTTSSNKQADMAGRLSSLYESLADIIKQYRPGLMAVEQLYAHGRHPRTAILMGHARGVILLAAGLNHLPVVSYNSTRIKKTITGNGRAGKDQVQRAIQRELHLPSLPEPPDVADALAAALCHYYVVKIP
jgi:crossover junction endodeoxyribonuclease RuvC